MHTDYRLRPGITPQPVPLIRVHLRSSVAPQSKIQNPLACLEQLGECSLVQAAEAAGEMRFRLLETLREYGAEQLSAKERAELAGRHACYYLALAEEADRGLRGP